MSVVYGLENLRYNTRKRAVAVGVFDGVHLGHRAIFHTLIELASEDSAIATAMTFEKHPAELLAPTRAPLYINTLEQRVELIQSTGVEDVIVADFNPALASLSPEQFLRGILKEKLCATRLVVGRNFRFGHGREGDIKYISDIAPKLGLSATVVPDIIVNDAPVSSTRIRTIIARGDVAAAATLLGRRFRLRGVVVVGRQIGRTLGFPTANVRPEPKQLVPARGVYAVEVVINSTTYSGVCNIGCRPTFCDDGSETIEVHLGGFQGNIYGERLDVIFCRRLRDEMSFESPEHLADQIRRDMERANTSCPKANPI